MKRKNVYLSLLIVCLSFGLIGSSIAESSDDLSNLTLEELITKAKEEGHIESVGMPEGWAAWERSWAAIETKYGITHNDVDMSSAEEIALFAAERNDPTKDIGDVGLGFASVAIEEDVVQSFKPSTWDSIPDWAKDPEGRWIVSYTGTICFMVSETLTGGVVPTSWQELMDSDIIVSPGDVIRGASSQVAVLSCAIAMGGGFDNIQPGIDYFVELARAGRLDPGDITKDRLATGEIQLISGRFDFDGVSYRDDIKAGNNPNINIVTLIPQDGAITTGYTLIFNKYSPRPHATALAIEYLLSDEGQIDRAYGGARPIREVNLPDDIPLLPNSMYGNVTPVTDAGLLAKACGEISRAWEEQVLPRIR